jgi:hypothetical protein
VSKRNSAQLQWRASSILWTLDATLSGQLAKPSHLPVANRSSSPLNRLRHREGFVGDHRLQSCVSALLRRGNLWRLVRRAQLRLRLRAFLCAGGVRPLTTTPRLYLRCRQSGCLSHRPLAHNHHLLNRQTRTPLPVPLTLSGHKPQSVPQGVPPSAIRNAMAHTPSAFWDRTPRWLTARLTRFAFSGCDDEHPQAERRVGVRLFDPAGRSIGRYREGSCRAGLLLHRTRRNSGRLDRHRCGRH